jgi:hypothetical protein
VYSDSNLTAESKGNSVRFQKKCCQTSKERLLDFKRKAVRFQKKFRQIAIEMLSDFKKSAVRLQMQSELDSKQIGNLLSSTLASHHQSFSPHSSPASPQP